MSEKIDDARIVVYRTISHAQHVTTHIASDTNDALRWIKEDFCRSVASECGPDFLESKTVQAIPKNYMKWFMTGLTQGYDEFFIYHTISFQHFEEGESKIQESEISNSSSDMKRVCLGKFRDELVETVISMLLENQKRRRMNQQDSNINISF